MRENVRSENRDPSCFLVFCSNGKSKSTYTCHFEGFGVQYDLSDIQIINDQSTKPARKFFAIEDEKIERMIYYVQIILFFNSLCVIIFWIFGRSELYRRENCPKKWLDISGIPDVLRSPKNRKKKQKTAGMFLMDVQKVICSYEDDLGNVDEEFYDGSNKLSYVVKGHCKQGKKHGNFSYTINGVHVFTIKYINDEISKTACKVKRDNTDLYECLKYFTHHIRPK